MKGHRFSIKDNRPGRLSQVDRRSNQSQKVSGHNSQVTTYVSIDTRGSRRNSWQSRGWHAKHETALAGVQDDKVCDDIVKLFQAWDQNGDGFISRSELSRLMRFVLNGDVSQELLDQLIQAADQSGDGFIDFEEFIHWIYNPKTGLLVDGVLPSRIASQTCPPIVNALQEWYCLFDTNLNGSIDYGEYAVACMMVKPDMKPEDITVLNGDFSCIDRNVDGKVTWPEFLGWYARLLDGVPQPVEEKVKLIRAHIKALANPMAEHRGRPVDRVIHSKQELLNSFNSYGDISLRDMFQTLDEDGNGVLSIIELRNGLEKILKLPKGTRIDLQCVRSLFAELDSDGNYEISLEELEQATLDSRRSSPSSQGQSNSKEVNTNIPQDRGSFQEVRHDLVVLLGWHQKQVEQRASAIHLQQRQQCVQSGQTAVELPKQDSVEVGESQQDSGACTVGSTASRHGPIALLAVEVVDITRVTVTEFSRLVNKCLYEVPEFREDCKKLGPVAAVQHHLRGWTYQEIFDSIDKDELGYISLKDLMQQN